MISSLTAEKLACARGERLLFEGLSFRVTAGQALAVEGANGAGKTSLLRLIAGFLNPRAGRILLNAAGHDNEDGEERGKFVGWLGHQDGLKPQLTVAEQLSFFARLYRSNGNGDAALEETGLARQKDFPCRFLSAGQRRRLALARLLVSARPLWLLDEPFAALDSDGQALMARTMALGFFALVATLVPLGIGADLKLLARVAGGVLWVGAVLAALLSLDRLFQGDFEDGSLDVVALSPLSLESVSLAKILAHWLSTGLPLTLISPLLALLFNLPAGGTAILFVSLLIGTPAVSAVGAIGASLTLSLKRGGLILPLIILPLLSPAVIFGAGSVAEWMDGTPPGQGLMLLAAFAVAACLLSPFATAGSVRLNLAS